MKFLLGPRFVCSGETLHMHNTVKIPFQVPSARLELAAGQQQKGINRHLAIGKIIAIARFFLMIGAEKYDKLGFSLQKRCCQPPSVKVTVCDSYYHICHMDF